MNVFTSFKPRRYMSAKIYNRRFGPTSESPNWAYGVSAKSKSECRNGVSHQLNELCSLCEKPWGEHLGTDECDIRD